MSNDLKGYKKALERAKINKINFKEHTIDKDKVMQAYREYQTIVDNFVDIQYDEVKDLIKYEKWLLGE